MTKKADRKSYRVYLSGMYGPTTVEADRYELLHDDQGFGQLYIALFVGEQEVALFPERCVVGIVAASQEVQSDGFNAFR